MVMTYYSALENLLNEGWEVVHIGLDRLEMFLLPLPIWDCQTAELPSSVHRNRGHKTDGEINIGVRRLAHEKAHRYDLRREQLGCATAGDWSCTVAD